MWTSSIPGLLRWLCEQHGMPVRVAHGRAFGKAKSLVRKGCVRCQQLRMALMNSWRSNLRTASRVRSNEFVTSVERCQGLRSLRLERFGPAYGT